MRVELRKDLNDVVARMVAPKVDKLAVAIAREAQARAPAAKVWVTAEDERVRPSHADADGQEIPENLRFKLRRQIYLRGGGRGSRVSGHVALAANSFDLGREPRDEDLPEDQRVRCRCIAVKLPGLIARKVSYSRAIVEGDTVRARVSVTFNRIVESHTGTSGDRPNRFLAEAVDEVAARLRRG